MVGERGSEGARQWDAKRGRGREGGIGGQVFQRKPACVVTGFDGNDEWQKSMWRPKDQERYSSLASSPLHTNYYVLISFSGMANTLDPVKGTILKIANWKKNIRCKYKWVWRQRRMTKEYVKAKRPGKVLLASSPLHTNYILKSVHF